MSRPATAKASKSYSCSCGCGEVIKTGQTVIVHMGDFYAPGHYTPQLDFEPPPTIQQSIQAVTEEPQQCILQLF